MNFNLPFIHTFRLISKLLLVIPLFVLSLQTFGQNLPKCSYITTENGLGFRNVKAISQDGRGLIWIGTSQGLERYDGNGFIKLNNKSSADISFPGESIQGSGLFLLNESTLIILADEKLYKLDICTNKWAQILLPKDLEGKFIRVILAKDKVVYTLVEAESKIYLLKYVEGQFILIQHTKKTKLNGTSISLDSKGNIWWETSLEGLLKINQEGKILSQFKLDSTQWYESKLYNTPVFIDNKDQIFIFPKSVPELWQYFPEENRIEKIMVNLKSSIHFGFQDSYGHDWFSGPTQLIKMEEIDGKLNKIDFTNHIKTGLNFTFINHLFEDKNGILWISTNNGIIKIPIETQLIKNYLKINGIDWGNEMRGIFESNDGSIFTYCENGQQGLYKIESPLNHPKILKISLNGEKEFNVLENAKHFVHYPYNDKVYFLTNHLYSIDLKSFKTRFEEDFIDITGRLNHNPMSLLKDGNLILGWELANVTLYHPISKTKKRLFKPNVIPKNINTECFVEDTQGLIWIGTNAGVYVVNRLGDVVYWFHKDAKPGLNVNHILSICIDHLGNVWLGSFAGGLNYIKIPLGLTAGTKEWINRIKIDYFGKKEGLCNENVTGILEDKQNTIWASTYEGLSRYYPKNKYFQTYNVNDGISADEFNYTSSFKDCNGNLWFGGMNGLNQIDPNQIEINKKKHGLVLLSFLKYNLKTQNQEKYLFIDNFITNPIDISPNDGWFQVNWSLTNYLQTENNSYYTKLEGIDTKWNYNGNSSFIRFHNLPYGGYKLLIKGADSKGNWSSEILSIPLIIHPFFYQTWWFKLLVVIIFLFIVYLIFQYNLNKRLEMERMRTQIASDLHDEVGSMLSGLAMQSELLQLDSNKRDNPRLENISNISRSIIGKMRDLVWSIDSRSDSVKSLIERMKEQASDLFQSKDIAVVFEIGDLPLKKELSVQIRQQLFLIYNEAINNVARHAEADKLVIKMGNYNGKFGLSIKDNGKKNKKLRHTTGLGMSNMEMRAKKLGASINFIQNEGFEVKLEMYKI